MLNLVRNKCNFLVLISLSDRKLVALQHTDLYVLGDILNFFEPLHLEFIYSLGPLTKHKNKFVKGLIQWYIHNFNATLVSINL